MSTQIESCHIKVGERVETNNHLRGTCRYVGPVKELGNGIFVGIELDDFIDDGNDGSIDKTEYYFNCNNGHGQFILFEQCTKIDHNGYNEYNHHHHMNGYNKKQIIGNDMDMNINNNNNMDDIDNIINNDDSFPMDIQYINSSELDPFEASKTLNRKFKRRKSQLEIERQGIVPPNYFNDPIATTKNINFGHEMVSSNLEEWLPQRVKRDELESRNIVPHNYFEDPIASTKGKHLVKEMISSNLEEFHDKRPTLDELQMKNIMPTEFIQSIEDPNIDHHEAYQQQIQRQESISKHLNDKLSNGRRPTITDLGDMHIIPHDYLDNLLEDAVANHQRKQSRMDHVQNRLQKHLPQPVAATLAETLVTSVQDEEDQHNIMQQQHDHNHQENIRDIQTIQNIHNIHNNMHHNINRHNMDNIDHNNNNNNDDDEWQISFVYEPMQNFVPMNPAQKDEVTNTLERRLSLRPSKQQIEVWGFVPPQYFESPEQSFLRQALGREIALDLLEGFFPNREDIYNLTNRGIMHPDFITQDHSEAVQQQHQRKKSVMDELNNKLDPHKRPSIVQLSDRGLIPENWLLDLYGLADEVRKRHHKMDSAVLDLKSQLNVPPILADVVARDVLDEIETVDPYLNKLRHDDDDEDEDDDDDEDEDEDNDDIIIQQQQQNDNKRRSSKDNNNEYIYKLKKQIEELKQELTKQNRKISILSTKNQDLEKEISLIKQIENKHLIKISSLENTTSKIRDQTNEINRLREEQNSMEIYKLDSKAIEIELSKERLNTQRLRDDKNDLEDELLHSKYTINHYENQIKQFENDKIELIQKTNQQINQLRDYLCHYQKYFNMKQQQQQQQKQQQKQSKQSIFGNMFG